MFKKLKKLNYIFYLCLLITIVFLCYAWFFRNSFFRLYDSLKDLVNSIWYYFCKLFSINNKWNILITTMPTSLDGVTLAFLPKDWNIFLIKIKIYFRSLWSINSLLNYLSNVLLILTNISKILIILLPFIFVFIFKIKSYYKKNEKNVNEDSKPLILYKEIVEDKIIKSIKNFYLSFKEYLSKKKIFRIIWICLWLLYFNLFSVFLEVLSYYLYFVMSFDLIHLYLLVYKVLLDLSPMLEFIPLIVWLIIVIYYFNYLREEWAYNRLNHYEMRNRGFINSTGQVTMICAPMGKGKTTTLTDIALSQEIMFRDKALELLILNDLKFPYFPFINLEKEIKRAIEHHVIYNLATAKIWVNKKRSRFYNSIEIKRVIKNKKYVDEIVFNNKKCFDYDIKKYGLYHDDNLKKIDVFDMIYNYVQLYFVYIIESSLLISNYGIREDNVLKDLGNFPVWHSELFRNNTEFAEAYSRHAHILDFDMLRLGKKVVENNIKANVLEFGVIVITEGGKERGNQNDTKEMKKTDKETNQKNDGFNLWLKMARHCATIDNFPFIKVLIDEQRPESMGADARELCEKIVFIREKEKLRNTLMFFGLDIIIYEMFERKFIESYLKYRFFRSDNTLLFYLIKKWFAKLHNRFMRLNNTFGYNLLSLESEKGTLDNQFEENKYYIMHKKIYSKRFATDCWSDFFANKSLKSQLGLDDLEEFEKEKAMLYELLKENSYVIMNLYKYTNEQENLEA